jgi:hypothetical protein
VGRLRVVRADDRHVLGGIQLVPEYARLGFRRVGEDGDDHLMTSG